MPSSGLRILGKVLWKPFDEQFGDVLDKFRRHRRLAEEEARLAEMIESAQERAEASKERVKSSAERDLAGIGRGNIVQIKEVVDLRETREIPLGPN